MALPEWLKSQARPEPGGAPKPAPKPPKGKAPAAAAPPKDEAPAAPPPPPPAPQATVADDPPPEEPESPKPASRAKKDDGAQVLGVLADIERQISRLAPGRQVPDVQPASPPQEDGPPPGELYPDSPGAMEAVASESTAQQLKLKEREARLEEREAELETHRRLLETVAAEQKAAVELKRQLEDAHAEIEQLTDKSVRAQKEVTARLKELNETNLELQSLRAQLAKLKAQGGSDVAAARESHVKALTGRVGELEAELSLRDKALGDYRERLERLQAADPGAPSADASAMEEMVQRQRHQIERLTEQLASLKSGDDQAEIRARDARIAALETQLDQSRSGSSSGGTVARLVAGIGGAMRSGKRPAKRPGMRTRAADVAALEARVEELTDECERLREELDQTRDDSGSGDAAAESLRKRVVQLEQELAGGQARAGGSADGETVHPVLQESLRQMQESLAAGEEEMVHRWVRPRAVVLYGWLTTVGVVIGLVSALAADRFFPPTVTASVTIQAKTGDGSSLNDADAGAWRQWHSTLMTDAGFLKTVAKRLAALRLDAVADPQTIGAILREDLTIDSPRPDELVLTLAGSDPTETAMILDTVVGTLAVESVRQAERRKDTATIAFPGDWRDDAGRLRYATPNPKPISDRRFVAWLVFFIAGMGVSAMAILGIVQRLLGSRRAMDEDALAA